MSNLGNVRRREKEHVKRRCDGDLNEDETQAPTGGSGLDGELLNLTGFDLICDKDDNRSLQSSCKV